MNALTRKATAALGTALTAASVLVALGGTAANAADVTPNNSGTIETGSSENLPPDQLALLESDQLKRVSIDPATGDITAVHPMTSAELQSEISAAKSGAIQTFSLAIERTSGRAPTSSRSCAGSTRSAAPSRQRSACRNATAPTHGSSSATQSLARRQTSRSRAAEA